MSRINIATKGIQKHLKELAQADRRIEKAVVRAINKTAPAVRTEAARRTRETYYVKHGEVLKKIKIIKATRHTLSAVLDSKDRPIRLINFSVSPKSASAKKPKVLRVGVQKLNGKKKLSGAFIATIRGGHTGVFHRTKNAKHRKTAKGHWSQTPIEQLRGPAIPSMLRQEKVLPHIQKKAAESIDKFLLHELKREEVID